MKELKQYLEQKKFHSSITSPKHLLKKFPWLKTYIDENLNFGGQLYCIINDIEFPKCIYCNAPYTFISFKKGFLKNCNNKCNKNVIEYKEKLYKKENNKVLVCEKHNKYVTSKIFYGLIDNKVESLCELCSLETRSIGKVNEFIADNSKNNLKSLFINRKKFSLDYLKSYYPNFYLKVDSLKTQPNNIHNHINLYLYDYDLKCKNINCNNTVSFNKTNNPNEFCETCRRSSKAKEGRKKFMEQYWQEYILNHFNIDKNVKIDENTIIIKNYCTHHKYLQIKKLKVKSLKRKGFHGLCDECNKDYYKKQPLIVNKNFLKDNWASLKTMSSDKLFYKNPYMWAYIVKYMETNKLSFSEAKYVLKYDIKEKPKCLVCNKNAIFSKDAYGYLLHCEDHKFDYTTSLAEKEIYEYVNSLGINSIRNTREIINGELDLYIPTKKLAIEYNGLYWHNEEFKQPSYHYKKWEDCKNKDIKLISIWEDDWNFKQDLVKSIIKNQLGLNDIKIGARKCEVKIIDSKEKHIFLDLNHLQGNCQSSLNLGLFFNNELISLMTFGHKRKIMNSISKENEYELLRFCNKQNTSVMGAASKLFMYFIKIFNPISITSYASCDISNGALYKTLGFKFIKHSGLNYWWTKDGIKYHRSNFMKHKLVSEGADYNLSESEIMRKRGYIKIYGTGNLKFIWESKICEKNSC